MMHFHCVQEVHATFDSAEIKRKNLKNLKSTLLMIPVISLHRKLQHVLQCMNLIYCHQRNLAENWARVLKQPTRILGKVVSIVLAYFSSIISPLCKPFS